MGDISSVDIMVLTVFKRELLNIEFLKKNDCVSTDIVVDYLKNRIEEIESPAS